VIQKTGGHDGASPLIDVVVIKEVNLIVHIPSTHKVRFITMSQKKEIREREKRYQRFDTAQSAFLNSKDVQDILNRFKVLLDHQPSKAACHRFLKKYQLITESYGTFIKHWNGAENWISRNISYYNIEKILNTIGEKNEFISTALIEIGKLWKAYNQPLPFHGGPLFDTSHYMR
jgi:hypothetical protein